jgi:hypothetical protein
MNKINKFIVIALAALLLQSCASELQISELQLYAQRTADVYEKVEFHRWDQLVKHRKEEIRQQKISMTRALTKQSKSYRVLRAYLIRSQDYSMFAIDDTYVDSSSLMRCLNPKYTDLGKKYLLEFTRSDGHMGLTLVTSNHRRKFQKGVDQIMVRVLKDADIVKVLMDDVWNYVECTERVSPGLDFDLQSDWRSSSSYDKAYSFLLMMALAKQSLMVVTPARW